MCARFLPVVNAPRTRCCRACVSPIPPIEFRRFELWQFPTTIHYPLQCCNPVPPSPARDSETCYNAGSSQDTPRLDPNALHTHICPPTMPKPPTMSTCSEPNVRILPQANFAPGSVGNNSKCTELPSVAQPTHSVMTPATQPMSAPPAPGSLSCHEKHAAVVVLRTFGTQNDIFCAFSRQKRQGTDSGRILLRESMSISCHEKRRKNSQNRPKLVTTAHSIPFRSPFDTRFPKNSQPPYDTITTLLGQFWTESAPFLRTCAASPTRRLTPPSTSTLISTRAGEVARDEILYSPERPRAPIPATAQSAAGTRVKQRTKQKGFCRSCNGAHAMLAHRARRRSER